MSLDLAISMIRAEVKDLESKADITVILRRYAKTDKGRLTEFGKKLIQICLEHGISQNVIAKLLDIHSSAVNQHAKKRGERVMDVKTKCAMINWVYEEVDVNVKFQGLREGIPDHKGKAKFGRFEGNVDYIMITTNMVLTSICGRLMGEIADKGLATGITAFVSINGEQPVDGFVESVNVPFGREDPNSFPIVLIRLSKLLA